MAEHKKHAGHGIKSSHITHHHDGSHTMEQHHEDGSMTSSAKGDLDQVHDHLENTIGSPNEGEQMPAAPAAPAAAPAMPAPAAAGM
jgi:hypothetical protein